MRSDSFLLQISSVFFESFPHAYDTVGINIHPIEANSSAMESFLIIFDRSKYKNLLPGF